jgi:hypothetical protein
MKTLLAFSATVEAATGLLLLAFPSIVVELLTGTGLAGSGIESARIAGISLVSLALAAWPRARQDAAFAGLLVYNSLVAVYLGYLGVRGEATGKMLWPAVAFHVVVTVLLTYWRGRSLAANRGVER